MSDPHGLNPLLKTCFHASATMTLLRTLAHLGKRGIAVIQSGANSLDLLCVSPQRSYRITGIFNGKVDSILFLYHYVFGTCFFFLLCFKHYIYKSVLFLCSLHRSLAPVNTPFKALSQNSCGCQRHTVPVPADMKMVNFNQGHHLHNWLWRARCTALPRHCTHAHWSNKVCKWRWKCRVW